MEKIQAIIYIAHGSRLAAGIEEAKRHVDRLMAELPFPIQKLAFIDFAKPSVEEAVEACVKEGASRIAFIPLLLLEAGHAKKDLPAMLAQTQRKYPEVYVTASKPFGVEESIVDSVIARIKERTAIDKKTRILLVARGSSDARIRKPLNQLVRRMQRKLDVNRIRVCYLVGQEPSFEEALDEELEKDAPSLVVVPYLLFDGLLLRYIIEEVERKISPYNNLIVCRPLGIDENLSALLKEKVWASVVEEARR